MDQLQPYRDMRVSIQGIELAEESSADLAPLIDVLREEFFFVDVTYTKHKPPLAGGAPTVLTLVAFVHEFWPWMMAAGGLAVGGLGAYAAGLLGELGKLHAGRLDKFLAKVVSRQKPEDDGSFRDYVLLALRIERVRLAFDETIDEEEYRRRMAAAQEYLASLPDSAFTPRNEPPDYDYYYWNPVTQSWQNGPYISPEKQERLEHLANPKGQDRTMGQGEP